MAALFFLEDTACCLFSAAFLAFSVAFSCAFSAFSASLSVSVLLAPSSLAQFSFSPFLLFLAASFFLLLATILDSLLVQ